jgi:4'-phosphopantetheinyl transferase
MTQSHWQPGPARPRLEAETVDVWLVALDCQRPDGLLDERERERAARFARERDGRRWAGARAALRQLLAGYLDVAPAEVRFEEGAYGKPALAAAESGTSGRLRFNLSHSGELGLVAVALDREVGVDVELPRRAVDHVGIARRVLTADEADRIAAIADPDARERAFLRAWVRWEALLKCRGIGIGGAEASSGGSDPWVADLVMTPPAAGALAVEHGPVDVRTWRWPPRHV